MSLQLIVKVNQINNLSDARYCAGMGVQLLGFNFDATGQAPVIDKAVFEGIRGWLAGIDVVAELGQSDIEYIHQVAETIQPDYIEIESLNWLPELCSTYNIIYKTSLRQIHQLRLEQKLAALMSKPKYLLINLNSDDINSETAALFDELAKFAPVLIEYKFDAENTWPIIRQLKPQGIVLTGGHEEAPGLKDFDGLADILELLECEN